MSYGSYEKLQPNGFVKEGTYVSGNDVIIGKTHPIPSKLSSDGGAKFKDASTTLRANEEGIVDRVYTHKNGEGYRFGKVRIKSIRVPEIGDKFACLKGNCEVLVENTWKKIKDIKPTDKVAILDNDNVKYEYPEAIHKYDYDGKMYQLKSQQVDLTVTPNHRMWIKKRYGAGGKFKDEFEFQFAEDCFGKRLKYKKNVNNFQPEKWIGERFTIPEYIDGNNLTRKEMVVEMNDWLTFFGIWVAEGWSDSKQVGIAANKPRVQKALDECLNKMGFKISKSKDKKWRICDVQLANYMKEYSVGAVNKFLPDWCWNLNKEQCRTLLSSMELGDGYRSKSNNRFYYTSSKQLADDVTRLALHAGYSTHVRVPEGRKAGNETKFTRPNGKEETVTTTTDNYVITIIKKKVEPTMNHGHCNTQNGQSEEWIDYKGSVHCLTVRTGVFLVRQNGKPVWTGNSRHAQKGTIGMTYSQEDMPFTKDGIVPDLIVNPNALPSRMTIAQLMECVYGKVGALKGVEFDATAYRNQSARGITEALGKLGFKNTGTEVMYNGKTGAQLKANIFIGPTFYQRLKHLVKDKVHSRATGPYQLLTRQPSEGRARDGGLRIGEMERDCFSHKSVLTLSTNVSIAIEDMTEPIWDVLGWDAEKKGLVKSKQIAFMDKGKRDCVKLTLEDGRTMECTPDHPLLLESGEWVKAKDIKLNDEKLVVGITGPQLKPKDEIKDCNGWTLKLADIVLKTDTVKEYLKTLAFMRILGYMLFDGHITQKFRGVIYLGHKLDVASFMDDLKLFCEPPSITKQKTLFHHQSPTTIHEQHSQTRRTNNWSKGKPRSKTTIIHLR